MKRFTLMTSALCCLALSGCVVHDHHRLPAPRGAKVIVPAPAVDRACARRCRQRFGQALPTGSGEKGQVLISSAGK